MQVPDKVLPLMEHLGLFMDICEAYGILGDREEDRELLSTLSNVSSVISPRLPFLEKINLLVLHT